jgi:peptide/nickel transport system substrate-binding protein
MAVNQHDYAIAIAGDDKNGKVCPSFFTCGTPMASTAGSEALTGKRDLDKAKALIKEAGYKGEKIVLIYATDQPIVNNQALVTQDILKKLGLNVELAASDWGTMITRRGSKEPVEKGGWSIFHTWFVGPDITTPALNSPLRGAGEKSWFGWPTDPKLEELRDAWFNAPTPADQKKVAEEMQKQAFQSVPYVPTAQFIIPTAYRTNLSGVIISPVTFLWNVEKK